MTLREALNTANIDRVYQLIYEKDSGMEWFGDKPTIERTIASYSHVIEELRSKPKTTPYKLSWVVAETVDPFDNIPYPDVCFLNHEYEAPAPGLQPWGGREGEPIPEGYFNCNLDKHSKYFGAGMTPWSEIIDTPIINEAGYPLEKVVAEILWEMTFYGWSEEQVEEKVEDIKGRIDEAIQEIKEGKCVELPPSEEGGYKIVIPDSVSKTIIDLANGEDEEQ